MKRVNKFRLRPTKEQEKALFMMAEMSAVLWNKVNYKRRQTFFAGSIDWDTKEEYEEFKKILGATTTQQVIRKNDEAWKSFLTLLKMEKEGKLPEHIKKVSPPRYWKDRNSGKRELRIYIRNDCYHIIEEGNKKYLKLPKGLKIRITGNIRWRGKQGRLEIYYDRSQKKWYALQSVEVEERRVKSTKRAYIDLGVVNILTGWIEGEKEPILFSGRELLADWWYWTKKIAKYQSMAKKINGRDTTQRIQRMFRKRQERFRHGINTIVSRFVKLCYEKGVGEIVIGDISHIRDKVDYNSKANSMIHNFWSFRYIIDRIKTTAENYGIRVRMISEEYTSSYCPFCGTKGVRRHRGLFYCPQCNQIMNADVVGVLNIAKKDGAIIPNPSWRDRDNGVLAHPVLLHSGEAQTSHPEGISSL